MTDWQALTEQIAEAPKELAGLDNRIKQREAALARLRAAATLRITANRVAISPVVR